MKNAFSSLELKTQLSETLYLLMSERNSLIVAKSHVETTRLQISELERSDYKNDFRPYNSWFLRIIGCSSQSLNVKAQALLKKKQRELFNFEHTAEVVHHEVSRLEDRRRRLDAYLTISEQAETENSILVESNMPQTRAQQVAAFVKRNPSPYRVKANASKTPSFPGFVNP